MDAFDQHYDFVNSLETSKKTEEKVKCCEIKENYQDFEGILNVEFVLILFQIFLIS